MLRALARSRRAAKTTQGCTTSDPLSPSSPTLVSLFASLKQPTRSTRSRRSSSQSPRTSCSPSESSSPAHSSQSSRSSSRSRGDTPCTSSSSLSSAPISPSDTSINLKRPESEKHRDPLHNKSSNQTNTCDSNPETFLHQPGDPLTYDPDFVRDTLRPERSILRGAGPDPPKRWVHVLNMTLEEIYQGKTFHFRLVRYKLSGKKSIIPLDVTIPLGSRDGTEVIATNVGNERKDGMRQDIVFLVKALKHNRFSRVHDDLLLEVRLPWVDSLNKNEGEVRLNSVDGKEYAFHVDYCKTGLLTGTTIIPNAGMPHRAGNGRGRIIVRFVLFPVFYLFLVNLWIFVRWEISSPLSSWDSIKHVLKFKKP